MAIVHDTTMSPGKLDLLAAWLPSSGASSSALDASTKARVETKVQELIDRELKPKHVKPPPEDARFNYLTDITFK